MMILLDSTSGGLSVDAVVFFGVLPRFLFADEIFRNDLVRTPSIVTEKPRIDPTTYDAHKGHHLVRKHSEAPSGTHAGLKRILDY